MPESAVDRVMESPMRRHLGKDYGWKFEWGDAAINGVMAVFEEAEQSNDYPLAMRRMCAALRKKQCGSRDKSMMKRVRYRHISNTSMSGSSLIRMPRHQSLQASKRSRC